MNREAVLHRNTEEFIYPVRRNRLIVRLRAARKEIRRCELVFWDRTDRTKERRQQLFCHARDSLFDYFQAEISFPKVARYQKYYFCLEEKDGTHWYYSAYALDRKLPEDGFFEFLYANGTDIVKTPQWARGAVFYQIFPERFCDGDAGNNPNGVRSWGSRPDRENHMGGDLEGVIEKLPYLKDLGVECLYLNPIFAGDFNHKYATTDYFQIDPQFGTNETFGRLVRECHSAGIRIILDGVFNHTGVHFAPFRDLLEHQEDSAYKDWFYVEKYPVTITHHAYECVGAYKWMPKLNTANPRVRSFILRVMEFWIREYGIDGWRLDVADEVDPSVWQEARLLLKEKYPDTLLLGETWGYGGKMLRGNQMDTVMNYLFRDAVLDYFAGGKITAEEFDSRINRMLALHRDETNDVMYNLIDSHDTERFLYSCGGDKRKMKLAVAFQMLFPGAPAIYYGDEAGMTGGNDPDCRGCMVWGEDADGDMLAWYRSMTTLRWEHSAIRLGGYRSILADGERDVYGFVREYGQERFYILLHRGEESCRICCPVAEDGVYMDLLSFACYESVPGDGGYNGDITGYKAQISVEMEPYSVKVIKKKGGTEV